MDNPLSDILDKVDKILKITDKTLATDEIVCACYLNRFLENGRIKDFHRFKRIFNNLSDEKRHLAINYYITYSKNTREQKKKTKVKKK